MQSIETFDLTLNFIRECHGGTADQFIPLHEPRFTGNERKYVIDAIDSTYVSSVGAYVNKFEEVMAQITGAKYAIATVNGTAALHMSMILAGVGRDEEVITQALTFVATANAISYIGAHPIFVDVDDETMGLSPDALSRFLEKTAILKDGKVYNRFSNRRIAGCVPMHTFGFPALIEDLARICHEWSIPIIEDAAESLGSYYKGKHTGTFGLLGAFSFNGNKTVTCGGGGAIVTNDENLARLAKHLTTQAKTPHPWEFNHDQIGYNYRMPNLNAALACAQLEMLDNFVDNKRDLAARYEKYFASTGIRYRREPKNCRSNYWLNCIQFKNKDQRDKFLNYSNANKVMTRPVWRLMSDLEMFRNCQQDGLPVSREIASTLVNIPSSVRI